MKNKTTIAIGIFFLVFVLVLVGSVSAKALLQKDESSLSVEEEIQYQSTLAAYEAQQEAYEQLIQQANEQLMEANATLAARSDSTESQVTETAGLTPEEAVVLAQAVAILPESLVGSPELVNFEGSVAYEVKYEEGAIYVSYVTGEILLNGTATLTDEITIEQAEEIAKNYLGLSSIYLSDDCHGQWFRIVSSHIYCRTFCVHRPNRTDRLCPDACRRGFTTDNTHLSSDDDDEMIIIKKKMMTITMTIMKKMMIRS